MPEMDEQLPGTTAYVAKSALFADSITLEHAGSVMVKVVPAPGWLVAAMIPP